MPFPLLGALAPYLLPLIGGAAATGAASYLSNRGSKGQGGIQGPGFFKGSPGQSQQIPRYNQQQQNILNQLLQMGGQGLGSQLQQPQAQYPNPQSLDRFNQPFDFAPIRKQALEGFYNEITPRLAEQYTSMGNSSLTSPDFKRSLGQAGASLENSLASLQAGIGREDLTRQQTLAQRLYELQHGRAAVGEASRMGLLQNLLNLGLTPQNENLYQAPQPSTLQSVLPSILGSLGLYGLSGAGGFGGQQQQAPLPGLSSGANFGLPNQGAQGFGNQSLYGAGLNFLSRPF